MHRRRLHRSRSLREPLREAGQTALALVLLLTVVMVTIGGSLALNAEQHDPLVQADVLQHDAYRALEAGINVLNNTINQQPNFVVCSTIRTAKTCTRSVAYDTWTTVQTTGTSTIVPEYYMWANPTFCFSRTKVADTACATNSSSGNLEYVRIEVIGAAGHGSNLDYQRSVVNFAPKNGFLTHVYWSNYNVVYPTTNGSSVGCATTHSYDWQTSYNTETPCTPVTFISADHIAGPIFSNDSIYVRATYVAGVITTKVNFASTATGSNAWPVYSADATCQFVGSATGHTYLKPPTCSHASTWVKYTTTLSRHATTYEETIPTANTALATVAAISGCLYNGPTVISFYGSTATTTGGVTVYKPKMHVWSPETPRTGTKDLDNAPTNKNKCFTTAAGSAPTLTPTSTSVTVPSARNSSATFVPNGVIYVKKSTVGTGGTGTCSGNGDNPLKGSVQSNTADAQMLATGTNVVGYNYTADAGSQATWDCEGDVFVRDARSGTGISPGITGSLTVAAQNNAFITGNLNYLDCKRTSGTTAWTSKATCAYNVSSQAANDTLGIIATHFIEVSHPAVPNCTTTTSTGRNPVTTKRCTAAPTTLLPACTSTTKTLTAVFCNPYTSGLEGTGGVSIDAALLALHGSFLVNEWKLRSTNLSLTGSSTGTLYIYGAIAQDYRGAVGTLGTTHTAVFVYSGYAKYYTFDSRLQYVSIPSYLTPGTPSWVIASSSVSLSNSLPTNLVCPYGTTGARHIASFPPNTSATHTKTCN